MDRERIGSILAGLYGESRERRAATDKELNEMILGGLSTEEACMLIKAAAKQDPREQFWFYNAQHRIVFAFLRTAKEEYISSYLEIFPSLMDNAKLMVLQTLALLKTKKSAEAFMELLRRHVASGELRDLSFATVDLQKTPIYPEIFFPEILSYARAPDFSWEISNMAAHYIKRGMLDPRSLAPYGPQLLVAYNEYRKRLLALKERIEKGEADREEYSQDSARAEVILELLGYIPGDAVEKSLREGIDSGDAHTMLWAVVSLLRQGKEVDPKHVEVVAADAETRNLLYDQLQQLKKTKLFPKKYRTQEAFAESQLVNWLTFPTELGRAPDAIELVKVVSEDVGGDDGILDLYLFKFRCESEPWKENGWMAGVAGAYRRKDAPTTTSRGCTFSEMEPWESKTPEQHVNDTIQYLADLADLTKKGKR